MDDTGGGHGGNVAAFSTEEETAVYDRLVSEGLFSQEAQILDRFYADGGSVLDLGCGAGRTTKRLAERGFEVTGVDVSESVIERARRHVPEVDLLVGDATELPFAADAFDHALFSYNGLDYPYPASARRRALDEIHRVLAPGGVFAFSSHNSFYRFPAALLDRGFVSRFYLNRTNAPRLFRRYKVDAGATDDIETYFSNPIHQWRQLRRHGFELLAVVGKREGPLRFFEAMPHYVARAR